MKNYIYILFVILTLPLTAQDTLHFDSEIKKVKVFYNGAQVYREAQLAITKGVQYISFNNLPSNLDEETIKVIPFENVKVQSVQYLIEYDKTLADQEQILRDEVDKGKYEIKFLLAQKRGLTAEANVLSLNQDFRSKNTISVEKFSTASQYYAKRLGEIKNEILLIDLKTDSLRKEIKNQQLAQNQKINQLRKPMGKILVKINSSEPKMGVFKINYLSDQAQWYPEYSFKVNSINEPLQLSYKAKVLQNTSEDWSDVKILLSEVDPRENKICPELTPWVLEKGKPKEKQPTVRKRFSYGGSTGLSGKLLDKETNEYIPFANIVVSQNGNFVSGGVTDFNGDFNIKPLSPGSYDVEISSLGYEKRKYERIVIKSGTTTYLECTLNTSSEILQEVVVHSFQEPLIDKSNTTSSSTGGSEYYDKYKNSATRNTQEGVSSAHIAHNIKQNISYIEYEIETPYSIPSNGEEYSLTIQTVEVPATYKYYAIPKLQETAFLTAKVKNWSRLKLLSGKARIFYQGSYVGETYIDSKAINEEYFVSLGKDKNIRVVKELDREKSETKETGSQIKNLVYYNFTIINKTQSAIDLQIVDQIPITRYKDIKIEYTPDEEALWNAKKGIIKWNINAKAEEKSTKSYFYRIQYLKRDVY